MPVFLPLPASPPHVALSICMRGGHHIARACASPQRRIKNLEKAKAKYGIVLRKVIDRGKGVELSSSSGMTPKVVLSPLEP